MEALSFKSSRLEMATSRRPLAAFGASSIACVETRPSSWSPKRAGVVCHFDQLTASSWRRCGRATYAFRPRCRHTRVPPEYSFIRSVPFAALRDLVVEAVHSEEAKEPQNKCSVDTLVERRDNH